MTTMISEVFDAFRAAGVPEDKARRAAEALAEGQLATKEDLHRIEKELMVIKGEMKLIKWMLGFNLAISTAVLFKLLV